MVSAQTLRSNTMDNRNTIATEALALFAERGYDAVGVQDIALAAGITKPTLYHYFGSKRGLLETLMHEHFDRLYSQLNAVADYRGDLPQTLGQVVRIFFWFARAEPQFYRVALSMWLALPANESHQVVAPLHKRNQARLEQLFREAAADHGNMQGRHIQYAASLLGMLHSYITLALNGYLELDEQLAEQTVRQFSYGIYS